MSRGARLLRALALVALAAVLPGEVAHASAPVAAMTLEQRLRGHVETLASPAFAGRRPGTEGETQTLRYLVRQWFEMGLESGTNLPGSPWFAPVELVAREPVLSRATFLRGRRRVVADEHDVFVVTSGPRNLVESAPVLFVGHGVVPSRTELAGRVALLLEGKAGGANAHGNKDERQSEAQARREAAGRLLDGGAMAVITVLDGVRTLEDVVAKRRKAGMALAGERVDNEIEAFVSPDLADRLLGGTSAAPGRRVGGGAGGSGQARFHPHLIGTTASLEATSTETRVRTHNLIGRIPAAIPTPGPCCWWRIGIISASAPMAARSARCGGQCQRSGGDHRSGAADPCRRPLRARSRCLCPGHHGGGNGPAGRAGLCRDPPLPLGRIVAAFNVTAPGWCRRVVLWRSSAGA
jgi:hypothetical protein